jgi:hypothetical protein
MGQKMITENFFTLPKKNQGISQKSFGGVNEFFVQPFFGPSCNLQ